MTENTKDAITDVVKIFPVPFFEMEDGIPPAIKISKLYKNELKSSNFDLYLHASHPFLTISGTEPTAAMAGNTFVEMEENPNVKITAQRGVSGLIFSGNIDVSVKMAGEAEEAAINQWIERGSSLDYILMDAEGNLYMMRSLPGTSDISIEDNFKKDRTITLRISMKTKSGLIPIV